MSWLLYGTCCNKSNYALSIPWALSVHFPSGTFLRATLRCWNSLSITFRKSPASIWWSVRRVQDIHLRHYKVRRHRFGAKIVECHAWQIHLPSRLRRKPAQCPSPTLHRSSSHPDMKKRCCLGFESVRLHSSNSVSNTMKIIHFNKYPCLHWSTQTMQIKNFEPCCSNCPSKAARNRPKRRARTKPFAG